MFLLSSFYRDIANTGDIAGFPLGFRHQKSRLSRHFMVKKYIIFPNMTLKRISFFQTNISKSWKTSEIWLGLQFIYQNMQNQTNSNCNELIKNQHNLTIQWFHGHTLTFYWDMAKNWQICSSACCLLGSDFGYDPDFWVNFSKQVSFFGFLGQLFKASVIFRIFGSTFQNKCHFPDFPASILVIFW